MAEPLYCRRFNPCALVALLLVLVCSGCAYRSYQPAPLTVSEDVARFESRDPHAPALRELMQRNGIAVEQWPLRSWNVEQLSWLAVFQNTEIAAASARLEAARVAGAAASVPLNPNLRVTPEWHRARPDGARPWGLALDLDVPVLRQAKRAIAIEQAAMVVRQAELDRALLGLQVRASVRDRYLAWVTAGDELALTQRETDLAGELVKLIEKRLSLGYASALDLANANVRQSAAQRQRSLAQLAQQDALTQLALVLAMPVDRVQELRIASARPSLLTELNLDDARLLRERALTNRLDVERGLLQYEQAELALRLEIARQYPDLSWRPGLRWDPRDAVFAFGVALALPILNRNEAAIDQAQARRSAIAAEFSALQTRLLGEVETAADRLRNRRADTTRSTQWVVDLEQRNQRIARRFEAGGADRLEWVLAKLDSISAERAAMAAQSSYWAQMLAFERTLASPVVKF